MTSPDGTSRANPIADVAATALLTIDLAALVENYRALAARAPTAECSAVVKADAYGVGAEHVVSALAAAGCRTFFAATLNEASDVKRFAPQAAVYALDGLFPGTAPFFAEAKVRPVLNSLAEICEWADFCNTRGDSPPAAIHIDTGMNRLGLQADEVAALERDRTVFDSFSNALLMSHLACADEPAHAMNEMQRHIFDVLRAKLPDVPASLANSAGIFLGEAFHYDMIRPGIALYGGRAVTGSPNPMRPVVTLSARIAQIRMAQSGEAVGYGATRKLDRESRIATVMTGYADGVFRHLGAGDGEDGLTAYIKEYAAPILGRVSMDMITIDVTDVPEELARRGAMVELIGGRTTVDDLANKAGTIGYEVLTGLGRRYQRVYTGAGEAK